MTEINKQLAKISFVEIVTNNIKKYIDKNEFNQSDLRRAYHTVKNVTKIRNKVNSREYLNLAIRLDLISISNPLSDSKEFLYYFV